MAKVNKTDRALRSAEGSLAACEREALRAEKALAVVAKTEKEMADALEALDQQMANANLERQEAVRVVETQKLAIEVPVAAVEVEFKDLEEKFAAVLAEGRKQVAETHAQALAQITELEAVLKAEAEKIEPLIVAARQTVKDMEAPFAGVREAVKTGQAAVNLAKEAAATLADLLLQAKEKDQLVRVYAAAQEQVVSEVVPAPVPPSSADKLADELERLASDTTEALGLGPR